MNSEAIVARVAEAKTQRDLPQLLQDLESVDPHLLFKTLFPIATNRQGVEYGPVAFSAYTLYNLEPPCAIAAEDAIQMLIDNEWDISIEEVPWYLTNQFGYECVKRCVQDFQCTMTEDEACVRLRTILYWSALTPDRGRTRR
ncbi:MAG: hypothetical protein R3C53_15645 [Pirellulaceae bacterium]